jgi:uncharacterized lipoprotein
MQHFKNFIYLSGIALILSACAHSRPGETKFTKYAQTAPPIVVPSGITDPTAVSYYPVPLVTKTAPFGTQPPLAPPGSHLVVEKKKPKTKPSTPDASPNSPTLPVPR